MKDYIVSPERVVNVKKTRRSLEGPARDGPAGRDGAESESGVVSRARIGAARSWLISQTTRRSGGSTPRWQGGRRGRHAADRNIGTVGGNLMQRPRCWYFRNEEFHCLKKGGSRCFAVEGENQYHAIFGDGPCHIVHPSSLAVPLIAYGARVRVLGPPGAREMDLGELYQLPNQNLYGETVLQPNEIITHVLLPRPGATTSASYEVRLKQSHDWPLALASVNLVMEKNTVRSARVVMGAVAPIPWRAQGAERVLAGKTVDQAVATEAAAAAVAGAKAMSGNAHKIQIARTAVKRAILKAAGLAVV
jgi:xanthine dehydrogenase YagS FAD-binding subunit